MQTEINKSGQGSVVERAGNPVEKVYNFVQKVNRYAVTILLACMVLIVFGNVISRYFLKFALAWSEEVSRFMFIWLVFLGAVLAYVNDEHLGLDLVIKSVPKKVGEAMLIIVDLLVAYSLYLIAAGGLELARGSWKWLSPASSFSYGVVYTIVPVCTSFMLLQTLLKLYYHTKKLIS